MVYARALVAATKAATADRDPGPLQAALDEALGAEMPAKCAAAVKARKLLRKLNKEKAKQEEEAEAARAAAAKQKAARVAEEDAAKKAAAAAAAAAKKKKAEEEAAAAKVSMFCQFMQYLIFHMLRILHCRHHARAGL